MREQAILRTLSELDRWKRKRNDLRAAGEGAELEAAERQVAYYEALSRDMKREVQPVRTRDFLSLFSNL